MAAADIRRVSTTVITSIQVFSQSRREITENVLMKKRLVQKVIAIGVPTVIDAATISKVEIKLKELAPLMVTDKGY